MPPTLDLSRTAHSKMIVIPPRINLRRAASYNYDKGPLSSTSSRFSFNHLVFSPPPSPGLPSLSPPPPRKPSKGFKGFIRPRRVVRILLSIVAIFFFFQGLCWVLDNYQLLPALQWTAGKLTGSEPISEEALPKFPSVFSFTDQRRRSRWTVSIPQTHGFPLTMSEYSNICVKCREIADRVEEERSQDHTMTSSYLDLGLTSSDDGFVDVREAKKKGYLPTVVKGGTVGGVSEGTTNMSPCAKSLTVVLESTDAGIASTLMMLWTAYGLAKKEGRAFFVDDTRWAYGKYSDIFQPPPSPKCSAPPSNERIPCPRQARHLVVTKGTFQEVFPDLALAQTGSDDLLALSTRKYAFTLARRGHDALFRLNKDDAQYVEARVRDLLSKRIVPKNKGKHDGVAVGIHVRRGDRHPFEYQYRNSYIPLDKYTHAARTLIADRTGDSGSVGIVQEQAAKDHSFIIVASDDPMVYESGELVGGGEKGAMYPAQDRIRLASKQAIQNANPPDKSVMHRYTEEPFGWEGGFFSAMFWNLGMGSAAKSNTNTNAVNMAKAGAVAAALSDAEDDMSPVSLSAPPLPSDDTLRLRSLVGRAYMMDLAVLSDASDSIVCTVSSVGCRLLAVMLGWDSAIDKGNWVNIDGSYGWLGV
ncbi:hypothetical protein QBC37DRAFT_38687 [Rhypophila decipiens]|uniref:Uncharacterized protein n=1 Tax=Rhypophila decipiens TaxID=261697 RepID=A0AAN6YFF7_9PEZI|nr:hypothetical protein QBC37DRAFT_38687 [Rhypophila decipiens]